MPSEDPGSSESWIVPAKSDRKGSAFGFRNLEKENQLT